MINSWIGYFDRSYEQAKQAVFTKLGVSTPEISDHTESNPFVWIVDIFMALSELLHYYIDNAAREVFLLSARQYKSAQKIAKLFSYRLKGYSAASVEVKFYIENAIVTDIVINTGTVIKADEVEFMTVQPCTIVAGSTEVMVLAIQRTPANINYTSDGLASQKVNLADTTVDKSATVVIDGVTWTFVEDFNLATPTSKVFSTEIDEDQKFNVVFGDGVNGEVPQLNANVVITYYTCVGAEGNVATGAIDTIDGVVSNLVQVMVTNENYATGGAGIETLDRLKRVIPASIRTLERAVTPLDFTDIAEMHNGVEKAFVDYHCGASVEIFIVPTGTGAATQALVDGVKDLFYDETRLIMMEVDVKPAGRIMLNVVASIHVLPMYNRAATAQKVKDNLKAFISPENQDISGKVHLGDVYQTIENTEGVDYCEVTLVTTIPEATIVSGENVLSWERTLLPSSDSMQKWVIKYIGSDNYELRQGSSFLGQFPIGTTVNLPTIQFKVLAGSYTVGDSWEFTTYRYNGSVYLQEPSIATIDDGHINLTATGGV